MTPPDPIVGTPEEWLARAQSNLVMARLPLPSGAVYEDLCFQAQQAAEKAIKAVYQSMGIRFRFTHDLEELLDGLTQAGINVPAEIQEAGLLTPYSVEARYPGFYESVSKEEYETALELAEKVLSWAVDRIASNSK